MIFSSPIGELFITHTEGVLYEISLQPPPPNTLPSEENLEIRGQLEAFFSGRLKEFHLPLRLEGTPFQKRVWETLRLIPRGETMTYGEVAARLGQPGAARAVGGAAGKNRLLLVVPCHRVLASTGLGGFSCGISKKIELLQLEGVQVN